jgi:hypothetical protein
MKMKMKEPQMTTVYFLGAGFSRGLGAPLFRDLFRSFPGRAHVQTMSAALAERISSVLTVYRNYGYPPNNSLDASFWRDPEEFIDVLETAATADGGSRELLTGILGPAPGSIEKMVDLARRALAIECSHFLRGADTNTERWQPYLSWAGAFDGTETIISFNYDRVLELLKETHRGEVNHYDIMVPTINVSSDISHARQAKVAPVLKLHGSVDWIVRNGGITADPSPDLALNCDSGKELVLGVPGPDKAGLRTQSTPIRMLWDTAGLAVERAQKIVFLGYRFPVTDAFARAYFLEAIKKATDAGKLKMIEIVLGPNEHDPDVERMKGLLRFCVQSEVPVSVLPLYVEDYLSFCAVPA